MVGLEVEPEPCRCSKEARKPQRRIRTDGALALHDLVDPARGRIDALGKPVLAHAHRLEELLSQNLSWMDGRKTLRHGSAFLHLCGSQRFQPRMHRRLSTQNRYATDR